MLTEHKYVYQHPDYKALIADYGLVSISDWLRWPHQTILQTRTHRLFRVELPSPLPAVYLKQYFYPTFSDRLKIAFRGGLLGRCRARVEFDNLMHLSKRDLSPQVIAFGTCRKGGVLISSFLAIQEASNIAALDEFAVRCIRQMDRLTRQTFIRSLADFTRKMNSERFINGQYHWRNILVDWDKQQTFRFYIIDPSSSFGWAKWLAPYYDLACLDIPAEHFFTQTERLRFLKQYLGLKKLQKKHKSLIKKMLLLRDKLSPREQKRLAKIISAAT